MAASETCSRCGQEVRWGTRGDFTGYLHRINVDHQPIFGTIETDEDRARVERELDAPRLAEDGSVYTTRAYDIAKIKDKAKREAAQLEEEIVTEPIPEPEVLSTRIEIGDPRLPGGAKQILTLCAKHGWTAWATYSRGARVHSALGTLLGISDFVVIRMRLDVGDRRAVGSWVDGKFDFAWVLVADQAARRYTTDRADSKKLKAWIKGEEALV